jgi:hypothetical protein
MCVVRATHTISRRAWLALGVVVVLLAAPRLWGLHGGLPELTEPDGLVIATQAELLRSGADVQDDEILWGFYPHLTGSLVAFLLPGPRDVAGLEPQLAQAARSFSDVRLVVALLSLCVVPLTYSIARRFLCARWSLVASILSGASLLHLWFATQARPHAVLTVFTLGAVLVAMHYARESNWPTLILLALVCGFSIGSLESGVLSLLPAGLALWQAHHWRAGPRLIVLLALTGALAVQFYPFAFEPGGKAAALGFADGQLLLFGHRIFLDSFRGEGFLALAGALKHYDPWLALLALVALGSSALSWRRWSLTSERRRDLALLLSFALPYLLVFGLYGGTYQRFLLPLLPYLAIAVAWSFSALPTGRMQWALPALLCLPQIGLAMRFAQVRAAPTTVAEAARWIESNLEPGADEILFLPSFELPLPYSADAMHCSRAILDNPQRPWFRYQHRLPEHLRVGPGWDVRALSLANADGRRRANEDAVAWLGEQPWSYIVVEVFTEGRRPLVISGIHPALPELADRVVRFAPEGGADGENLPLSYSDDDYPRHCCWALRLLRAERMGPVIEIWRRRSGAL